MGDQSRTLWLCWLLLQEKPSSQIRHRSLGTSHESDFLEWNTPIHKSGTWFVPHIFPLMSNHLQWSKHSPMANLPGRWFAPGPLLRQRRTRHRGAALLRQQRQLRGPGSRVLPRMAFPRNEDLQCIWNIQICFKYISNIFQIYFKYLIILKSNIIGLLVCFKAGIYEDLWPKDLNPRSPRFVRFNLALNCLAHKAPGQLSDG